jgi:hypothetical protein
MDEATIDKRFDAARDARGYLTALAAVPSRSPGPEVVRIVALVLLLAGLSVLFGFVHERGGYNWLIPITGGVLTIAILVHELRRIVAPIRTELAMIVSGWSGLTGSAELQRVQRSVTLRLANGTVQSYAASGAVSVQNDGDVGIAYVQAGTLIGFESLGG